jgi:SsrA-binding protein
VHRAFSLTTVTLWQDANPGEIRQNPTRGESPFLASGAKLVSMGKNNSSGYKVVSDNRQARFRYEILETYEAGIELKGTEVKSIREGRVNLRDGYAIIRDGQAWLLNVHISPYQSSSEYFNHDPRRTRRLLLHKREISKLVGKVEQEGLTLIPLKMYLKRGLVKVAIGLCKGKKLYDKRETIKRRQDEREMARVVKRY